MPNVDWAAIGAVFSYAPERPLLFGSFAFLVLFTLFYTLYIPLRRHVQGRTLYLLAFSLYFYYLSSGLYFVLLLLSTLIDFVLGHLIYKAQGPRRKLWLWLSIGANLGLLGYFKYTNFLASSLNEVFASNFALSEIFLPVGISFFTFQTLSYSIDIYRGRLLPLTAGVTDGASLGRSFFDFAFFVSFFPQLVAGPIVRAADFIPQIRQSVQLTSAQLGLAFWLICGGLFKKAVISDYISVNFVDRIFENPLLYDGFSNLLAVYGYAIQIYCDFSGYSDMAIGIALLLGFRLPENFRSPYQSLNIRDFWQRWHISLSTWLRDYLYISLGGNRHGQTRTYLHLMLTMLLGGLWHGASWVFVVWGGLHGLALAIDRWYQGPRDVSIRHAGRNVALLTALLLPAAGWMAVQAFSAEAQEGAFVEWWPLAGTLLAAWLVLLLAAWLMRRFAAPLLLDKLFSVLLSFHFVSLCWIFFRAGAPNNPNPPLETTAQVLQQIATAFSPPDWPLWWQTYSTAALMIALGFVLHFVPAHWKRALQNRFTLAPAWAKALALALVIWLVIQTASSELVPFIYFQF